MKKLVVLASVLVLSGSLGATALFAGSAPSFAPARSYATGRSPHSVAIGDLNGDGKPDLAIANTDANTVSVLLNRGGGRFRSKRDYRTGTRPDSVAIGDLNGDATPDLVTANGSAETVSVLLNRGDASFQAKRDYPTRGGLWVAIGDLNGDDKPDLATANGFSTVSVLLNRGDGTFNAKRDYATGYGPSSVAIGDLNADGKLDLATNVSVLLNTPGLCTVQPIEGVTLAVAKRTMARASCRVGKIRRAYSRLKKGRVVSQKPRFGAVLPDGSKVNLVVSRGRKPS